jgi:hypothetical protein
MGTHAMRSRKEEVRSESECFPCSMVGVLGEGGGKVPIRRSPVSSSSFAGPYKLLSSNPDNVEITISHPTEVGSVLSAKFMHSSHFPPTTPLPNTTNHRTTAMCIIRAIIHACDARKFHTP